MRLEQNGQQVAGRKAEHKGRASAKNAEDEMANGLSRTVYLTEGSRLMLKKDPDDENSVINGVIGIAITVLCAPV